MHPSRYDWTGTIPDCADAVEESWLLNNLCYDCGRDNRSNWLDPLDPRVEYMLEEDAPAFDAYHWYVDEMPLNPEMKFREVKWNPDVSKVSEAHAEQEPLSPSTFLPEIPTSSASFGKSIMTAANRISVIGKTNARPQPQADSEDLANKFSLSARSSRQHTVQEESRAFISSHSAIPPSVPPRHTGRVLIIPHTATAIVTAITTASSRTSTATPTPPQTKKRRLEITALSSDSPNITLAPEPVVALDATDPFLASTLLRGQNARETRNHLRSIRDSPAPVHRRAKVVAETRVRLEEMCKGSSATFKGGLHFKPTKVRRGRKGEVNAVEFEGERVLEQLGADEVKRFGRLLQETA